MGINGSSYTSEIAARKARNRRLERQERIEIEVENRALKQELSRLRRVEAAHDALMSQCLKVTGAYSNGTDLQADREIRRLDLLLDELAEKAALEETTP